jgi:hypothetical protein
LTHRLSLSCVPFDQLERCIREASRSSDTTAARVCDQVRYLSSYLSHMEASAKTIVVESPYVDRHWLEEYAGYYATLLVPPSPHATRLHFFDQVWTIDDFKAQLALAVRRRSSEDIGNHYLGFAVIRPIPTAPIGRTVLKPYARIAARCFEPAELSHRVHVAGLTISFNGLPFQQQDRGVAACATTAIWSALTKVIRSDGGRAPTPFAVTVAATDHRHSARTFPALAGLDLEQMTAAIHRFGYQPHVFQHVDDDWDDFLLALKVYLRSGLPVVVRARVQDGDLHALTLVGFRECDASTTEAETDLQIQIGGKTRLR